MLVMLAIATLIVAAIHYYLWARLVRDPRLPLMWSRALTVAIIVAGASIPLSFLLMRLLPQELADTLLKPTYIWMGTMFLLLVAVGMADLFKGVVSVVDRVTSDAPDPNRRLTLARLFGFGAAAIGLTSAGLALREGYRLRVKRVEVPLERLPAELDGTTIAQITDLHVGPSIGKRFVRVVVDQINKLDVDLVAITGDLVDGSVAQLGEHVAPLSALKSRYGTFFVTGNHEYYSGADAWIEKLRQLNMRVLRNERVSIGQGEQSFDLAGVDDYTAEGFGRGHGADLAKATQGRDERRELVLLAHQPREVFRAQEHGVGLQISGHTHGGQIWPFNWLVRLAQPVVTGLEQLGKTMIYVSNGTGYWGPPMRLAAPAEISQIVLRSKAALDQAAGHNS